MTKAISTAGQVIVRLMCQTRGLLLKKRLSILQVYNVLSFTLKHDATLCHSLVFGQGDTSVKFDILTKPSAATLRNSSK